MEVILGTMTFGYSTVQESIAFQMCESKIQNVCALRSCIVFTQLVVMINMNSFETSYYAEFADRGGYNFDSAFLYEDGKSEGIACTQGCECDDVQWTATHSITYAYTCVHGFSHLKQRSLENVCPSCTHRFQPTNPFIYQQKV
jgi:hypothetical protein